MSRLRPAAALAAVLVAAVAGSGGSRPPLAAADDDVMCRLIADARYVTRHLHDYTCTFVKRERVNGQLLCEQTAALKCRHRPYSVHLTFRAPSSVAGQQASYVEGRDGGKMRVRPGGLLACVGCLKLELTDPRAMRTNRHRIDEAGLGKLVDQLVASHEREHGLPGLTEAFADVEYAGRKCVRVETVHTGPRADAYARRCVILFDRGTRLPVRFEAYDAPTADEPGGPLLEEYAYHDLAFNVGLTDKAFGH